MLKTSSPLSSSSKSFEICASVIVVISILKTLRNNILNFEGRSFRYGLYQAPEESLPIRVLPLRNPRSIGCCIPAMSNLFQGLVRYAPCIIEAACSAANCSFSKFCSSFTDRSTDASAIASLFYSNERLHQPMPA